MSTSVVGKILAITIATAAVLGCSAGPPTAQDVLERSLAAHGGDRLTAWQTLTVKGSVRVVDGVAFNAAYLLYARKPDKLRVERDSTVEGGRLFEELFLNGEVAWRRRNLLPRPAEPADLQRLLEECDGVAFHARHSATATMVGEGEVAWQPAAEDDEGIAPILPRPAFLVTVGSGDDLTELAIDRETSYLLRATRGPTRSFFTDFRSFGGVVWPTRVVEVTASERGERVTPYVYESIAYNEPIDDGLFTEDMPRQP